MIYEMARDIGERLTARKFPYQVVYGPERTKRQGFDPVIVFERDRQQGDSVGAPHGFARNPRKHATRGLGVVVRIYARSPLEGAHVGDHERDCEQVVDALISEIRKWAVEHGALVPEWRETRYLGDDEYPAFEVWPGVSYLIRFAINRGVLERDYLKDAQSTAVIAGTSTTAHVRYRGQESDPSSDITVD